MIFGTLPGGAPVELFELSSDKLTVGDLKAFSKALDIPIEEIRQAIKM